ncbi:MAG: SGNH/GDSL hydrolase family protein [Ktedonobacteraceae bacterium]|nr:SGNH/GDSL hydrolase family protein [Ktedonobacteraceae bacterium]
MLTFYREGKRFRLPRRPFLVSLVFCLVVFFVATPMALASSHAPSAQLVGPKARYLALGDSLAFGFQPDLDFTDGYTNVFMADLSDHDVAHSANLGCPGETSSTFIHGGCPNPLLRKYLYVGSQLDAAVKYLNHYKGQVSPVTLDIGANDLLSQVNTKTCAVDVARFRSDLAQLDTNLTAVILPRLRTALTVDGSVTGDLALMNYYDPYQNICPATVPLVQELNQHLVRDISGYGVLVDVFSAFGGTQIPNSHICSYTWICSIFHDIHARDAGYQVIARAFEERLGY